MQLKYRQLIKLSFFLFLLSFWGKASLAQPIANCVGTQDLYIDFFGTDTIFAIDLDNGSINAQQYLVNGQSFLTFDCADVGSQPVVFSVVDSVGQSDACVVQVNIYDLVAPQAICVNNLSLFLDASGAASLSATALDPSGSSFDACGIQTYLINGSSSINFSCVDTGLNVVTLQVTDFSGNSSTCSSNILVLDTTGACVLQPLQASIDTIIPSPCDSNLCAAELGLAVSGGLPPYQVIWSDGLVSTALYRSGLCPGAYALQVADSNGDTIQIGVFDVEMAPGCVWPGDTDDNHEVRNFDLLPIALAYGEAGLFRPNASIQWQGESAPDWNVSTSIVGLADWKHIDANGDAFIDSLDLQAITQNYGASYYPVNPVALSPAGGIPFFADTVQVLEGDTVNLAIHLGTLAYAADSVYAIAFTIRYDSSLVESGSVGVDFSNSWMGSDLLTLYKDFPFNGRTEIALGRKDRQSISGSGMIAHIQFTIRDDVFRLAPDLRSMPITIEAVRLIDTQNKIKAVDLLPGQVNIEELLSYEINNSSLPELKVYPNPAGDFLNLSMKNDHFAAIELYNSAGQKIMEEANPNMLLNQIDVSEWTSGVYLLKVHTKKTVLYQTVLIH